MTLDETIKMTHAQRMSYTIELMDKKTDAKAKRNSRLYSDFDATT
jgi:hypothetical protein